MTKARAAIAALLAKAKVLLILLSLLLIHAISIMRTAKANAMMRAGTGMTGFIFLILFSLQKQQTQLRACNAYKQCNYPWDWNIILPLDHDVIHRHRFMGSYLFNN